jgi:hypothetical protein
VQLRIAARVVLALGLPAIAGAFVAWTTSIAAAPLVEVAAVDSPATRLAAAALPAGPLSAVADAVRRPPHTPAFPYGRQHASTQAVYFLLRSRPASELDGLRDTLHRDSAWLRQLTDEARLQGFDPLDARVQAEGGALLWQLVPFEYPPLGPAAPGRLQAKSTSLYDPVTGTVELGSQPGRWPRAVSLIHEAMHAMQSQPGPVSFSLLNRAPWSARTWTYSATRDNPRALEAAVECGPSLLTGIATAELYHRVLPGAPDLRAALVMPSGRTWNSEWLLRQAHRFGVFGDTPTARALGYRHDRVVGINDLLGGTQPGRQFVRQLSAGD